MNTFTKNWLCATCAPESIVNIKSDDIKGNYLDVVRNESNTKQILILSTNNLILGIGTNYDELIESKPYTFSNGLHEIAKLLDIFAYTIPKQHH